MPLRDLVERTNEAIFFNARFGAEEIVVLPCGDLGQAQSLTVLKSESPISGSNEKPGDGRRIITDKGKVIRESILVNVPVDNGLLDERRKPIDKIIVFKTQAEHDSFMDDGDHSVGTEYNLVRSVGEDNHQITYLFVKVRKLTHRMESRD